MTVTKRVFVCVVSIAALAVVSVTGAPGTHTQAAATLNPTHPAPTHPAPTPKHPAPSTPWSGAADALFSAFTRESPGCALGVFQNGAMAYARGYGMASLEHDVPITPDSVFYAGSVSKQFTAMAAALAIEQGKLAYDDAVRKYLPELPAYADAIRIRHLIHHTSGLRDYNTLLSMAGQRDEEAWANRDVLRITTRQAALNFRPGDEYLYSNTGYTLLATIVERATGVPFAQFAETHIFKPLGMTASHFHVDARRLVRGRALAYAGRAGQWRLDTPVNQRVGAGGLYTSIPDLLKWDENFYTGTVGGAGVLKRLQTRGVLNNGTTLGYAWGLQIAQYRGLPIVEHGGSLGGYRAHVLRIPSHHTSVALLCNASAIAPAELARRVADTVPGIPFTAAVPHAQSGALVDPSASGMRPPDAGTPEWNRAYAGVYYSEELAVVFTVSANGTELYLQREMDAAPTRMDADWATDTYRVPGMTIRFLSDPPARAITGLTLDSGRVRGIRFVKR